MRSLFATTCLTPLALYAIASPLRAETLIDTRRTVAIATATIKSGVADDVRITAAGSIAVTAGVGVTLDSPNKVTNQGSIQITDASDSTGILAVAGSSGAIVNTGKITIDETYVAVDSDKDGDLDGPFAQGARRFGIHTAGAFIGNITSTGTISIEGNDSAGIALGGPLTGGFETGGGVAVLGDRSVGVHTGAISGAVRIAGAITAEGKDARGVAIEGDIGGALVVQGSIVATGFRSVSAPADVTKLDADDLLIGGPALSIAGNVAGGVILAIPPKDLDPKVDDEDKDGIVDAVEGSAAVTSYGSAAAVQIGANDRAIALATVAGLNAGLVVDGSVSGVGVYKDIDARGMVIGGIGGAVAIAGGVAINGSVRATSLNANATAIRFAAGATAPELRNTGTISASGSSKTGTNSAAIAVDTGASLATIRNSGKIEAVALGADGAATAIVDRSGSLVLIENSGAIAASGGGAGHNIAIDLRANSNGAMVRQIAGPAGAAAPIVIGDIRFGSGNDTLALAGKSSVFGNVDFGGGSDALSITEGSQLVGNLGHAQGVAVNVGNGALTIANSGTTMIGSLAIGAKGVLGIAIDGTAHTSTMLDVAGAASFAAGSQVAVALDKVGNAAGRYVIVRAGTLSGAANLGTSAAQLPFLFKSAIVSGAANEVVLDLSRKTAAELKLNRSEASAYEAVVKALDSDAKVAGAVLDIRDATRFGATLRQLLPDHAGGTFEAVTQASRATARLINDPGERGSAGMHAWVQQVIWGSTKAIGDTAGYHVSGWGIAGGTDIATDAGTFGISTGLLYGKNADGGTDNEVNTNQYEGAAYWRVNLGGFHANARVSGAYVDFKGLRQFSGAIGTETVARTAEGKWHGQLWSASSGIAYELKTGRLSFRPIAAVDYYRLHENAYAESGGGKAFDLIVGARTSDELAVSTTLAAGLDFGGTTPEQVSFRAEIEGGRRQIVGGSLGTTTARFEGGQAFSLVPEDRTNGWVGKLRAVGGNDDFRVAGEFGGEQQQGRVAITARISLTVAL